MIRKYTCEDKDYVNELGKVLKDNFDIENRSKSENVVVYEDDKLKRVLGFAVYIHLYETLELLYIVVDENYRRNGIGSMLMDYLTALDGVEKIILEVKSTNNSAIKFYENYGFTTLRTIKAYYNGIDGLAMERVIK